MTQEIKQATEQDIDRLLPFVRAFHQSAGLDLDEHERRACVLGLLANSDFGTVWLIFDRTELAGYIAICKGYSIEFGGFDAFIDEFFIRPDSRRRGLGTKVVGLVKSEAAKLGIRAIHLEVAKTNAKARKLYADAGFLAREDYTLMSVQLGD